MTAVGSRLVDVALPSEQSEGTETVISLWFKAVGDEVKENEPLLEVATDKVNVEIAAPASGRLAEILKRDGDKVEPGEIVGRISVGDDAEQASAPPAKTETSPQADGIGTQAPDTGNRSSGTAQQVTDLSPAVRKLLNEHKLDPSTITGTGRGGRITHQDVMNVINAKDSPQSAVNPQSAAKASARSPSAIPSHSVPHTQMRRSIAQHMVQSMSTAPHVTSVFDADLSAVIAHREANKTDFESRGAKLTYTAYFVAASVAALKAVPEANARWHDDHLELFDDINIGIATALENGGLIVPVITKAQDLDLFGIAQRLTALTERARGEKLDPKDVQHGTFTISNHGVSGSLFAAPIIINQPQVAILGVGKVEQRVIPVEGEVVTRPMCYVTLTIDHRVLDGYRANVFLTNWVERILKF